jgi:hypothetical protein
VLKVDDHYPDDNGYPSSGELALIFTEKTLTPEERDFVGFVGTTESSAVISALGSVPAGR